MPTSKLSLAVKAAGTVIFAVVRATSLPSTLSTMSAGAPGFGALSVVLDDDGVFAGRDLLRRLRDRAVDDHQVVFEDEMALVHVTGEAAAGAAQGVEHAAGIRAAFEVDGDGVVVIAQGGRGELGHAGGGVVEGPARVGRLDPVFGMNAQPDAGADGEGFVFLRLREEELLHFRQLLRLFLGEVVHLREVLGEIVEFPHGLARNPTCRVRAGRSARGLSGPKVQAYQPS